MRIKHIVNDGGDEIKACKEEQRINHIVNDGGDEIKAREEDVSQCNIYVSERATHVEI